MTTSHAVSLQSPSPAAGVLDEGSASQQHKVPPLAHHYRAKQARQVPSAL
jgi:hypothetical protein